MRPQNGDDGFVSLIVNIFYCSYVFRWYFNCPILWCTWFLLNCDFNAINIGKHLKSMATCNFCERPVPVILEAKRLGRVTTPSYRRHFVQPCRPTFRMSQRFTAKFSLEDSTIALLMSHWSPILRNGERSSMLLSWKTQKPKDRVGSVLSRTPRRTWLMMRRTTGHTVSTDGKLFCLPTRLLMLRISSLAGVA